MPAMAFTESLLPSAKLAITDSDRQCRGAGIQALKILVVAVPVGDLALQCGN